MDKTFNLKTILIMAAVLVVTGATAFMAGRYSKPDKIEVVEKQVVVTQEVVKIVEVEKSTDTKTKDENSNKRVHIERTEETKPDGTKIVKVTKDINVDRTIKETEIKVVEKEVMVDREVKVKEEVIVTKVVENDDPDWFLSIKGGVSTATASRYGLGIDANRRILGPVHIGLWGMLNMNTSFTPSGVMGGVSLGAAF